MLNRLRNAVEGWKSSQSAKKNASESERRYADSLAWMLADLRLEPSEISDLDMKRQSLGLSIETAQRIHRQAFKQVSKNILADLTVTDFELQALVQLSNALRVEWSILPESDQRAFHIAGLCLDIQAGKLPVIQQTVTPIKLAKGELIHAEIAVTLLDERVVSSRYVGGSTGVSFRIAKGVSYRIGSTRGRIVSEKAVVAVDSGMLLITSERIAYVGQKKSLSTPWSKLLAAEPMSDGIRLSFTGRSKSATLAYADCTYAEPLAMLVNHYLST